MSAIERLAGLLQFSDGLVEQAHFAEGDAEIVVRLRIFIGGGDIGFEILFEFAEHFGEIDSGVVAKRRSFGSGWRGGRMGNWTARRLRLGNADCWGVPGYGAGWAMAADIMGASAEPSATCLVAAEAAALAAIGGATLGARHRSCRCGGLDRRSRFGRCFRDRRNRSNRVLCGDWCALQEIVPQGRFDIGNKFSQDRDACFGCNLGFGVCGWGCRARLWRRCRRCWRTVFAAASAAKPLPNDVSRSETNSFRTLGSGSGSGC